MYHKTRRSSFQRVSAVCLGVSAALALLSPLTASRGAQTAVELRPQKGEIFLKGQVQSVTATRRIIMTVKEIAFSDGTTIALSPSRTKQVVVSDGTFLHVRGKANRVDALHLWPGVYVAAVGKELGIGMDLPAREVGVWTDFQANQYQYQPPPRH